MRFFIGTIIKPNELVSLTKELNRIKDIMKGKNVKWVDPKNLHITFNFLGDLNKDEVLSISEKLENIKFNKLEAKAKSIIIFPNIATPRVLSLELDNDKLKDLKVLIDKTLKREDTHKSYIPHVTLARFKGTHIKPINMELSTHVSMQISIEEISLISSTLSSTGSKYTKVKTIFLND